MITLLAIVFFICGVASCGEVSVTFYTLSFITGVITILMA